jgi:hypothetical protein
MRFPIAGKGSMLSWAVSIVALLCVGLGGAVPEPALVPEEDVWQLEVELHGEPQQVLVTMPGEDQPQRFWYLLYSVYNNTGNDVDFYPQFDLFTDTFKLYRAGVKSRQVVFEAIRQAYAKTIPLLESEDMITGRILQGQDNARDSVAIFEEFDPNATSVKIFMAGFSNETVRIDAPSEIGGDINGPRSLLLRKSLQLSYQVPGDRFNPGNRVMLYRGRQWIMR